MTSVLDLDPRTVLNSRHSESTWYTMYMVYKCIYYRFVTVDIHVLQSSLELENIQCNIKSLSYIIHFTDEDLRGRNVCKGRLLMLRFF